MNLFFSKQFSLGFFVIIAALYYLMPQSHVYLLLIAWIYEIGFTLQNVKLNAPLLTFNVAVFTFLMTRLVIPLIYTNDYITYSLENTISFDLRTYDFMYLSIFVAIMSVHIGYVLVSVPKVEYKSVIDYNNAQIRSIRQISKKLCFVTILFAAIEVLEKVVFVWTHSYLELYLAYTPSLPVVFYKLSTIYELVFYLFLATMPSKKDAKPILIQFFSLNLLSLLVGGRASFVLSFLFIIIYLYLRNDLSPNDLWLSKKNQRRLLIAIPIVCISMFLVMMIRGGSEGYGSDVVDLLFDFFFSQGSSMQVLGLTYEGKKSMPVDQLYSLGPLINVINDNFIFHIIGVGNHFKSQTVEIALHGHSLGNYLTYTYQPERFFRGGGLGSSYIAEVWADFGYVGIIIWSLVYGVLLAKVRIWCRKNVWLTALSFMMMMSIIYAPRANAISFVSNLVSPTYILVALYIYLYSKKHA